MSKTEDSKEGRRPAHRVRAVPDTPRREEKRAERRRQLIEAALEAIAERGFAACTVYDIARHAGLSHGLVNFHFDSKESLFECVIDMLAAEFRAAWQLALQHSEAGTVERVKALALAPLDKAICSRSKLSVWFAFWGEAGPRRRYREISLELEREYLAALTEALRQATGHAASDAATDASLISGLCDSLWLEMHLGQSALSVQAARLRMTKGLTRLLPDLKPGGKRTASDQQSAG
ncbi:MAG: TetR family transcriptional regulator [Mesorhizobium sp.]|uniref:TetR/AcrR family transcriptional regulator n=1 Tax=unclassified Mesorhizobium TaxID=325217 RepID=UPI000F75F905|nr:MULTISPECIES: TetR/AcrR family transcriptional regulator [unclassified Mesorhizobium]AZO48783.1 TetR family transcriptional regulator [Mesorhizobium sp. M4B.F.Ca.ET.058.02.1.1]RUX52343.1 TetR family transcriptional regulator [Mesorhizobium sp. M4A.F.Ca.ET.050.02.1.1]RVC82498.1 TetR family transcriptional regulator [Mesorhizobium sp. M4A.F.Ca.ET.022.05.2.1]RWC54530.1 MAG: TetR family transcriptional regulator [Mesorhizobium sp.]RWD04667.1 MAG: TetR family transcriptional regulator [Mesorhizo